MKKKYLFPLLIVLIHISTFRVYSQDKNWIAPKSSNSLVNPLKGDENATLEGKKIYTQVCVICHGLQGKGNGGAGVALNPKPANFLAITVMNETDGAIFWKLTEGKPPMASYKDMLKENQRWQLVNYIRKLEKK